MLTVDLQGGFGEKGRTSVLVSDGATCVMLDAGIKVGAEGEEYHPHLMRPVSQIDALFITHAHEDHIGALCWMLARGYVGPIWMTAQTRSEMSATLHQYARPQDLHHLSRIDSQIRLLTEGQGVQVGGLHIGTGHSGHVAGGVWFTVSDGLTRVAYLGDVVAGSRVFPMDPVTDCDLLILDASYGIDPVAASERAAEILTWVRTHPAGCLLPTPLSGRSLELMAILDMPLAIAADMRAPLATQINAPGMIRGDATALLHDRLEAATDWAVGDTLPRRPLLVHDGMGVAGPAGPALRSAAAQRYPVLLTGHLPPGSPAAGLLVQGDAEWVRMPTHPTLPENVALWQEAGCPRTLGHSCDGKVLALLHDHIPTLDAGSRTGHSIVLGTAQPGSGAAQLEGTTDADSRLER